MMQVTFFFWISATDDLGNLCTANAHRNTKVTYQVTYQINIWNCELDKNKEGANRMGCYVASNTPMRFGASNTLKGFMGSNTRMGYGSLVLKRHTNPSM